MVRLKNTLTINEAASIMRDAGVSVSEKHLSRMIEEGSLSKAGASCTRSDTGKRVFLIFRAPFCEWVNLMTRRGEEDYGSKEK